MGALISLPLKEANLLRLRLRKLLKEHDDFLRDNKPETIHDLRVASRRLREALGYLENALSPKSHRRLTVAAKKITRTLGPLRETETNMNLIRGWRLEDSIDPVAAELLIHAEGKRFRKNRLKATRKVTSQTVQYCENVLSKLRGSRAAPLTESHVLARRSAEFIHFVWSNGMTDEQLHDLRIKAKKFRYALEVDSRLHARSMGRLITRIRKLQEKLGELHDLFVLGELIRTKRDNWQGPDSQLIPAALSSAYDRVLKEKAKIYPLLFPLYSKVITSLPPELHSFAGTQSAVAG